jgi:glycosyltransferase involved in cell wall biosynthesis
MRIVYVVRSWPRLSQTFVLGEILALERLGVAISIFAMTRSGEHLVQAGTDEVRASVHYLDSRGWQNSKAHLRVIVSAPGRYLATLGYAVRRRALRGGYTRSNAFTAFNKAVLVAADVGAGQRSGAPFTHIHAHFAHDPALVGLLTRRLTGLPFTFTAHARDLYQIPDEALVGRASEASALVTCCRANVAHINDIVQGSGARIELIYHGVDLETFTPPHSPAEGSGSAVTVVSVGRLVAKKGFDDLLRACSELVMSGAEFRCDIYGDGPCRAELEALRDQLGLAGVVRFRGERRQLDLVAIYQGADLFVLTPRITADGDRDGIPNVVVEAMACGLPVVVTDVGGIRELVDDGRNGLVAPPRDVAAIAARLGDLLADVELRRRLGLAASDTALLFDTMTAARRLAVLFGGRADIYAEAEIRKRAS